MIQIDGEPSFGIKVSASIEPLMVLYFDQESRRLVRIHWRKDQHRFSGWKEMDGYIYASTCGYKASGKAWYFSEITQVEIL